MKFGFSYRLGKLIKQIGTIVYQSDFSAGVDNWVTIATLIAGNIDNISGVNDCLRCTIDGTTNIHRTQKNNAWTTGDTVRIKFDYYLPSANVLVDNIGILTGSGADGRFTFSTKDAWTTQEVTFTSTTGNNCVFEMRDGTSISFAGNLTDVFYIKNVIITKI